MNFALIPLLAALAGGSPADVVATLNAAGYAEVREVEFEDGLWGEVAIDPANGEVFDAQSPRPLIELPAVVAAIENAGYRQIHDIDREGALWDADAYDRDGQRVELRISGYDGRIVTVQPDVDD